MGKRRMLSSTITDNDNFIGLSASAQALYMHLCLSADDDGFSDQISMSMFKAHAGVQDLEALIEREYLIRFDSGVIVISHWHVMNSLRKDRRKETLFKEERAQILENSSGCYERVEMVDGRLSDGCQMVDGRLSDGCQAVALTTTKHNITKHNSCSSKRGGEDFTNIWESVSCEDVESLRMIFLDPERLIDEVHDLVRAKRTIVTDVMAYIIGYGNNRNWPKQEKYI